MPHDSAPSLDAIVEQIRDLTEHDRRTLLRRLRVSGLLPSDVLATDQRRLAVAPALTQRQASPSPQLQNHPEPAQQESEPLDDAPAGPYQSPVRGRVVVGAPAGQGDRAAAPGEMSPLPGQAPERPIGIIFDGGSRGNPGRGYGSYALRWPGQPEQIVQLQFGDRVTNNEAEYDTLIAALEAVLKRLADGKIDPKTAKLEVRGDSLLVINQVKGEWRVKNARMRVRRERARALIDRFGQWRLTHHDRSHSVRVLGH